MVTGYRSRMDWVFMSAFSPMASVSYPGLTEEHGSGEPLLIADANPPAARTANSVLASSAVAELRLLRVDENEDAIHLSGRVRSFYHKQLAQEAIRLVAAGRQVINRVDVCNYA